ncbi:MAG: hypothetical protein H6745_26730 [Deltaproteobacteria bacterium]|nr:hypothetical protein [Deltaproteobacteria bacterium]
MGTSSRLRRVPTAWRQLGAVTLLLVAAARCSDDPGPANDVGPDAIVDVAPGDAAPDALLPDTPPPTDTETDTDADTDTDTAPDTAPPPNLPPHIVLLAPDDGASFPAGAAVTLRAQVTDDRDAADALSVTWTSPLAGVLFDGPPAAGGAVTVTRADLPLGAHLLTLAATDSDGASATALLTVVIAPADGAPAVVIAPATPRTGDDLTASLTATGSVDDADGPLAVTWSWFRGPDATDLDGDTVPADRTAKGETWRALAVVSDGAVTTPPGVAQVVIGNTAPSCAAAAIDARTLTCACVGRDEPDAGDPASDRCAWTLDGAAPDPATDACALPAGSVAAGAVLGCALTPSDGEDDGETALAAPVVAPDALGNTPPTAPVVAITPPFSGPDGELTCALVAPPVDPDGDPVTITVAWAVGDAWGAPGTAFTVVPSRDLRSAAGAPAAAGDAVRCRVVASDGALSSPPGVSAPVVLGATGVALGGQLGDVALTDDLGDGCWQASDHPLPTCVPGLFCELDVAACFAPDGTPSDDPPELAATASLPGLGDVALTGAPSPGGGFCLAGAVPDAAPPAVALPLSDLVLTVCQDAAGASTATMAGVVTVEGAPHPFAAAPVALTVTGAGADLPALSLAVTLPAFDLGGTRFSGTLRFGSAGPGVAFEGAVTLAEIGALSVSGAFDTAGGRLTTGRLDAGVGLALAGVTFAGDAAVTLDAGVFRLDLAGGALTLPGGGELALDGAVAIDRGRLASARFAAGAGVAFAGVEFAGDAAVTWEDGIFGLDLAGGLLGPTGPAFSLTGAVTIDEGVVTGGALSAGADLAVAGVRFHGDAAVTWSDDELRVALAGGAVGLPASGSLALAGEIVLADGALASADFGATGAASVAGVAFDGAATASWAGGDGWTLALAGGHLSLPGGGDVTLAGSLSVRSGRVVAGTLAAGADLAFAGLAFSGDASAAYAASYDDLGNLASERLALHLAGARLALPGGAELTLAGDAEIAGGAVVSAGFDAGADVVVGPVRFAGAARVVWAAARGLTLELAGGQLEVAGASLTLAGGVHLEDGALACGELDATATSGELAATLGGVRFDLGVRFVGAGRTCTFSDGTTTTSAEAQFLASLANGRLAVGPATLTLAGSATLSGGALACAVLDAAGGVGVPVAGVDFRAGARYAAAGATCPWTAGPAAASALELTLAHGVVLVGGQRVALSGVAALSGGQVASAAFTGDASLVLPGATGAFAVSASYDAATDRFELALDGGHVAVAGADITLAGRGDVAHGQVGCLALAATGAATVALGDGSSFAVAARFSGAGTQCPWQDAPGAEDAFEVTLAGDVRVAGVTSAFSGAGRVAGGELACAELHATAGVSVSLADASFDLGVRYAAAGAACAWADGTETHATAPTLLAALSDGTLTVGGATLTLSGTGELVAGELTCVELAADADARFAVAGVSFGAGARYAAAGATCAWLSAPAAADTLEATLRHGHVRAGGADLVLSGSAKVEGGAVRCADLSLEAGADLAFGGVSFSGGGRFVAAGADCDGETSATDTDALALWFGDGHVRVGDAVVTLTGEGRAEDGAVTCVAFGAAGEVPVLGGLPVEVGATYAAAGVACPGGDGPVGEDTFALTLAATAGELAMRGRGELRGGELACAELTATGAGGTDLAGVAFDVGGRFAAAGHACAWLDGSETAAPAADTFVATLTNGAVTVGAATLALAGEGTLEDGRLTCATLDALGAGALPLGGVSFHAGARYAAEGSACGFSDGAAERLELTLHDGHVTVGAADVTLSGAAELGDRRVTCATLAADGGATLPLGGLTFGLGARYAARGESCGFSDGAVDRFEVTLSGGAVTIAGNTFTLSGAAELRDRRVACAELGSTGEIPLGGTTFRVGGRYVAAGATCTFSDGATEAAAADTLTVTLADGRVTVAGQTLTLAGEAVVRGGKLACAELGASAQVAFELGGVGFGLGGARFVAAGESCAWADGTDATAVTDTFALFLRDGHLTVGPVTLVLSGAAELTGGAVACADLQAGGAARLDVGGVSFRAGARFAAAGHECGFSDGAADRLELTLRDGHVDAGGVAIDLAGSADIAAGKLTCADLAVTSDAALAFGGVAFAASARFAAAGETCGFSDGAANRLELVLDHGAVDVGGASVVLAGAATVEGGEVGCVSLAASGGSSAAVGGVTFDVAGRFAAAGHACPWTGGPAARSTFELLLERGALTVGAASLELSGAGAVAGGRLTCAELDAAGGATADVGGVAFDLGGRWVAAGETCAWADGSTTTSAASALLLALRRGSLSVGGQTLTLSGAATLEGGAVACATLDALGAAAVPIGGVSFDAGARFAAAGHACPWTDGPAPADALELTLRDGAVAVGPATLGLSGKADIVGGAVTCADLRVDGGAAAAFGGLAFDARARFAALGSACGWSDAAADRLELVLDGASVGIGDARVGLSGTAAIEDRAVRCVELDATGAGSAPLGGLTFDVGARFAAAGATCAWTDGPVAANRLDVLLSGATVTVADVGAITLSGAGTVEGGALTCAELGASASVDLGGVAFDLGARYTRAGAACTWADGTATAAPAQGTFTLALLDGHLAVGPATLALSGAVTLVGGVLSCAELDASGGGALDVGGVSFAAGARYTAAGRTCVFRDGTATTAAASALSLRLHDGLVTLPGGAALRLAGTADVAGGALSCATFDASGGAGVDLAGVRFDAGARFAAAGHTCGFSDGAADTLELLLRDGALDVGGATVGLEGAATIAGGALTCASLTTRGQTAVGLGGVAVTVAGRWARAGASCDGAPAPAVDTLDLALTDGHLRLGPATLDLAGTAQVAGGRLTCAELDAAGGAAVDLAGVDFDAGVRYAAAGAPCTWADGTATTADASALLLALRDGALTVGPATLSLSGTGTIFGGEVACAELTAAGSGDVTLGGVAFDAARATPAPATPAPGPTARRAPPARARSR